MHDSICYDLVMEKRFESLMKMQGCVWQSIEMHAKIVETQEKRLKRKGENFLGKDERLHSGNQDRSVQPYSIISGVFTKALFNQHLHDSAKKKKKLVVANAQACASN